MVKQPSNIKVVIKTADKSLHKNRITIQDKKYFRTNENILKERDILKLITAKNNTLRVSIIKYIDFSEALNAYYLIQEFGGKNLLHYVVKQHCYIKSGKNKQKLRDLWELNVLQYMHSMVYTLNWLHDVMNIIHLDISLNNYTFDEQTNTIKLIDFGLSEIILNNNFKINKYVGKPMYKCPEINSKIMFDGRKADVWSLGVCFFMMYFGVQPWERAVITDQHYLCIINGYTKNMFKDYGLTYYATDHDLAYGMCLYIYLSVFIYQITVTLIYPFTFCYILYIYKTILHKHRFDI